MVGFIRRIFLKFFILTDLIANILEGTYRIYMEYRDKYIKYGTRISVVLFSIFFLAYLINAEKIMIASSLIIVLIILVPYYVIKIHLCTNSICYFLYTILIVFVLVCAIISSYAKAGFYLTKLPLLIYLILCILFSMISEKKVALIGNEIIGTIATFIYTLIMHYKENISESMRSFFLYTTLRFEMTAKELQEVETYSFNNFITQATSVFLIVIFISVVSIMLINLKEYCSNKYLKDVKKEYDENKYI